MERTEIVMELMGDIQGALERVARDFLPEKQFTVTLDRQPPRVTLRVPEPTHKALESTLHDLSSAVSRAVKEAIPSLPLQTVVIGGTEAAGIVISLVPGATYTPVYGHIIKAKVDQLFVSDYLKDRPVLVDEVVRKTKGVLR